MTAMTMRAAPLLLAYLHLRPGTPAAAPALMRDYRVLALADVSPSERRNAG
jgi:hypothetical protein